MRRYMGIAMTANRLVYFEAIEAPANTPDNSIFSELNPLSNTMKADTVKSVAIPSR